MFCLAWYMCMFPASEGSFVTACACFRGDSSILTLLLDKVKVDPNAQQGREQHAALHAAAKSGAGLESLGLYLVTCCNIVP